MLLMTVAAWAQNPKLSYQAVVRDNSNKLVTNSHVDVTISVLRTDNSLQYTQSFAAVPTNQNGLFSLLIGGEADWDDINWLHSKIAVVITLPDLSVVKDTTEVNAVPLAINARHSATVDPSALVQSNWIQEDTEDPSFIQNKPSISDTVNTILTTGGYVTASALDGRHYLTSDSTVIKTMQSNITTNENSIANLTLHTTQRAIRDSVAGQIHDSIVNIADKAHTHENKALLDTYNQTNADLADAVAKRHEHANAAVLAATQAPYTDADSIKLRGIADSAEVNVQSDWKQTDNAKDDYIKNKPSITDTVNGILATGGYVTASALDNRHYLTSDSAVIKTMQGNITTNATNITSLQGNLSAAISKAKTDSTTLAGRINALENASMDCNDVKDCIKDTLSKYVTADLLCNAVKDCDFSSNPSIAALLQGLTDQISNLQSQINAQNQKIDSLSNLSHGGGSDTSTTEFTCGDKIKDVDHNEYNTVKIGDQCWMKENLRTTKYSDNTSILQGNSLSTDTAYWYYPNDDESNKSTYGLLYNWKAVMNGASSIAANPSGVQGICPTGWHVPSDAEWDTLTDYVHNSTNPNYKCSGCSTTEWSPSTECIAKALASKTGWNTPILPVPACSVGKAPENNDATGFSAVPAGNYDFNRYNDFGDRAFFWSATDNDDDTYAGARRLYIDSSNVIRGVDLRIDGFSVRCLRDAEVLAAMSVTTDSANIVTNNSATLHGNVTNMGEYSEVYAGFKYGTSVSTLTSIASDGSAMLGAGRFSYTVTGLTDGTQYYFKAFAANGADTVYGEVKNFSMGVNHDGQPCLGAATVSDVDNNTYNTVKIGNQCWMKENLRTTKYADGTAIAKGTDTSTTTAYRYYPNNDSSNVSTYGYLYNWKAVMDTSSSSEADPSDVQGICPIGWHVPSDAEFGVLAYYVNGKTEYRCEGRDNAIANALSAAGWTGASNCNAGSDQPTRNKTGFSAVPAGRYLDGDFGGLGSNAYFWSATQCYGDDAWYPNLDSHVPGVFWFHGSKSYGLSVRCIKD